MRNIATIAFYFLFPFLNNKAPIWKRVISAFAFVYCLCLFFPSLFFKEKTDYKCFKLYSNRPLNEGIYTILDSCEQDLRSSHIWSENHRFSIHLCDNPYQFAFFCPSSYMAFGSTYPVLNKMFICEYDELRNLVKRNGNEYNTCSLKHTISHECTHVLLNEFLGFFKGLSLDKWKSEGYCDYVANSSSFPYQKGLNLLCRGKEDPSGSFYYFKSRMRVSVLFDQEKTSLKAFFELKTPEDSLDQLVARWICR